MRSIELFPITLRRLEVARAVDLSPGMRRITFTGAALDAHVTANGIAVPAFESKGFDDDVKLFLQHPDLGEPVLPVQHDGVIVWPGHDKLIARTYTVRRWDPDARELDVDFVLHAHGHATRWAAAARPGDVMHVAGPKASESQPVGADWVLIGADETALPAVGRWLEEWPAGLRAQVFIEIANDTHRLELAEPDGVTITWLSRDDAPPGSTTILHDAVTGAEWWDGTPFVWVMGEVVTTLETRRWIRNVKGLSRAQAHVGGYWRRPQQQPVDADAGTAATGDAHASAGHDADAPDLDDLGGILGGFAVRVAATIGLAHAIGDGTRSAVEVADACGCDRVGITKLLRYLAAVGLVEERGDGYALTDAGQDLRADYYYDELDLEGLDSRAEVGAALSLLTAVRSGVGDHSRWFGVGFEELVVADQQLLAQRIEHESGDAQFFASAVVTAAMLTEGDTLVVAGPGAVDYASALAAARPARHVTVVASPAEIAAHTRAGVHERVALHAGSPLEPRAQQVDVVLLTDLLERYGDVDAAHVLRQAAASVVEGGSVMVFSTVGLDGDDVHDHDYVDDLRRFALTGGGRRTTTEFTALVAAAGLTVAEHTPLAWGSATLSRLVPSTTATRAE